MILTELKDICLYCNAECFSESPNEETNSPPIILKCSLCQEQFLFVITDRPARIELIEFSCNKINLTIGIGYFFVYYKNSKHFTEIPTFDIDFSNKEKLYNKLKTYILFS